MKTMNQKAVELGRAIKARSHQAATTAAVFALTAGPALAQETVDTASIEAKIALYSAAAVGLIVVFLTARWGIKALGLMKPRG